MGLPQRSIHLQRRLHCPEKLAPRGNGVLVNSQPAEQGWTRWNYEFKHELVNYLVMVAAGEYGYKMEQSL